MYLFLNFMICVSFYIWFIAYFPYVHTRFIPAPVDFQNACTRSCVSMITSAALWLEEFKWCSGVRVMSFSWQRIGCFCSKEALLKVKTVNNTRAWSHVQPPPIRLWSDRKFRKTLCSGCGKPQFPSPSALEICPWKSEDFSCMACKVVKSRLFLVYRKVFPC